MNRTSLFYGIGGGNSEDPRMLQHHEQLVELAKSRNGDLEPIVLTLPTAHHNGLHAELGHRDFFVDRFMDLDCEVREILIGDLPEGQKQTKLEDIMDWLEEADLIFVLGGDTRYLLKTVADLDLGPVFKEAYDNGVIFSGSSAGCIWVAELSMSDSQEYHTPENWDYISLEGLGFLPAMNVHDNQGVRSGLTSGLSRSEAFDQLAQKLEIEKAICVEEFAAVVVENGSEITSICYADEKVDLWTPDGRKKL